jgi:hypothetical protein
MAMSDAQALGAFVQLAAEDNRAIAQAANGTNDVMTVTAINEGRIVVQPIGGGTEWAVSTLKHVVCETGDEVLVLRVSGKWIVTGVISATMGGA